MKFQLAVLCLLMSALQGRAEFRVWTNLQGQKAELKLVAVKTAEGEKVGKFQMRDGRAVHLKASQFTEADAKAVIEWNPSVFYHSLAGNLVTLQGDMFQPLEDHHAPEKYYIFYYTASWCPPCRAFTPALVKWYEQNKNENFELVLITSDRSEANMQAYAKDKRMPWPQLKFEKAREFKGLFNHGVRGIPSLIVCDLKGEVLGNYRSRLADLTTLIKD